MPKAIKRVEVAFPMSERRKYIRHPLCFPLTYKVLGSHLKQKETKACAKPDKTERRTTSINISIGGLLFAARRPVKVGSLILIKLPFQDKIFNVRAKVAHCEKNPETKLYNVGVAFHQHSAAYKVKLVEQLYLISEFRDLRSIELGKEISLEKASEEWIDRYSARFRRLYW